MREVKDYKREIVLVKYDVVPVVSSLPTKEQGRPLLLGPELRQGGPRLRQSYENSGWGCQHEIVMAAAEGIIAARDSGSLGSMVVIYTSRRLALSLSWCGWGT